MHGTNQGLIQPLISPHLMSSPLHLPPPVSDPIPLLFHAHMFVYCHLNPSGLCRLVNVPYSGWLCVSSELNLSPSFSHAVCLLSSEPDPLPLAYVYL